MPLDVRRVMSILLQGANSSPSLDIEQAMKHKNSKLYKTSHRAVISSRQPAIIASYMYSDENRRLLHSQNDTENIDTEQV